MDKFKKYFCGVCAAHRINAGLSYKDISKKCGKSPSAIYRFERGDTNSIDIFMWFIINFNIDIHKEYMSYTLRRLKHAKEK